MNGSASGAGEFVASLRRLCLGVVLVTCAGFTFAIHPLMGVSTSAFAAVLVGVLYWQDLGAAVDAR